MSTASRTQPFRTRVTLALAGTALAATMVAPALGSLPARYTFQEIGTLGGPWSNGMAINNAGTVAGLADRPGFSSGPFIWSNGLIEEVPGLQGIGVGTGSALAINNSAHVVGYSHTPAPNFPGTVGHAFLARDGQAIDLEPNTDAGSMARDINDSGLIVGDGGGGSSVAALAWTVDSNAQVTRIVLNFPGVPGFGRQANGVNNSNVIVGGGWMSEPIFSYAAWALHGPGEPFIILPTLGGRDASAEKINDAGVIVGDANPAQGFSRPAIWTPIPETSPQQYSVQAIPLFEAPYDGGLAKDINNLGVVVGADQAFGAFGVKPKPWVYLNGEKRALEDLVDPEIRAEWTFWWAMGINDSGQITGIAVRNNGDPNDPFGNPGDTRAFILTPAAATGCNPADISNTDGDLPGTPDGTIDNGDFSAFFAAFFAHPEDNIRVFADIANTDGEPGGDGQIDNGDFGLFFQSFFVGCP